MMRRVSSAARVTAIVMMTVRVPQIGHKTILITISAQSLRCGWGEGYDGLTYAVCGPESTLNKTTLAWNPVYAPFEAQQSARDPFSRFPISLGDINPKPSPRYDYDMSLEAPFQFPY